MRPAGTVPYLGACTDNSAATVPATASLKRQIDVSVRPNHVTYHDGLNSPDDVYFGRAEAIGLG